MLTFKCTPGCTCTCTFWYVLPGTYWLIFGSCQFKKTNLLQVNKSAFRVCPLNPNHIGFKWTKFRTKHLTELHSILSQIYFKSWIGVTEQNWSTLVEYFITQYFQKSSKIKMTFGGKLTSHYAMTSTKMTEILVIFFPKSTSHIISTQLSHYWATVLKLYFHPFCIKKKQTFRHSCDIWPFTERYSVPFHYFMSRRYVNKNTLTN